MKTALVFSEQEINIFRSMIGKRFDKFRCDPFVYSPMVYGIVGLYIDGAVYKLTSLFESVKRFFNIDDVAVFHIEQVENSEIKTYMDEGELIETPVLSKIVAIDIITDHQTLEHKGDIQSLDYSVGIVFHLEDTREISFEIRTWFSEMITVEKGYNLIEKFASTNGFLEEWEDCVGYEAKCSREIIVLGLS
ncbi:MAG: hypothetical protein UFA98_06225 [Ruminococcus sp.]|nr:hypothetical protein [Ruminococcus sp.]